MIYKNRIGITIYLFSETNLTLSLCLLPKFGLETWNNVLMWYHNQIIIENDKKKIWKQNGQKFKHL